MTLGVKVLGLSRTATIFRPDRPRFKKSW